MFFNIFFHGKTKRANILHTHQKEKPTARAYSKSLKKWRDPTYLMNELMHSETMLSRQLQATNVTDARLKKDVKNFNRRPHVQGVGDSSASSGFACCKNAK